MSSPDDTIHFLADRGDMRLRLDQILVRRVTGVLHLSRTRAQQWIESGCVSVDGVAALRASSSVREGSSVEVRLPDSVERRQHPAAEPASLSVLFEDDHLLIVDKPAGIVVHPSYKNTSGTLLNAILWRVRDRPDVRPGILTRLDKGTTGIVVIALGLTMHARLQEDAAAGLMKKEYLAVVLGRPPGQSGRIQLPLTRDPGDRRRMITAADGMVSETRYDVIASDTHASLLTCSLVTGRTHQIRVHLASRGWPIVGDPVYGTPDPRIGRQALHAWRVTLRHPVTREPLTIESPVPADIRAVIPSGADSGAPFSHPSVHPRPDNRHDD